MFESDGGEMTGKEAADRLRYILMRCDEESMCKYFKVKTGCEDCCNAVRAAAEMLECADLEQELPEWKKRMMTKFMKTR